MGKNSQAQGFARAFTATKTGHGASTVHDRAGYSPGKGTGQPGCFPGFVTRHTRGGGKPFLTRPLKRPSALPFPALVAAEAAVTGKPGLAHFPSLSPVSRFPRLKALRQPIFVTFYPVYVARTFPYMKEKGKLKIFGADQPSGIQPNVASATQIAIACR
jgi:hypothetical protein